MISENCVQSFFCPKVKSDVKVTVRKNYTDLVAGNNSDRVHVSSDIMDCSGIVKNSDMVTSKCGAIGIHQIHIKPLENCKAEKHFQPNL